MMYERFTDRARKALQLANSEALKRNHEYLGVEHILLGILKEGNGVACRVLTSLGVDRAALCEAVLSLPGVAPARDMVAMGKLPQTPRAKAVIQHAVAEAGKLQHNYIGTEHLLLAILAEGGSFVMPTLLNAGLSLDRVRQGVLELFGRTVEEAPVSEEGEKKVTKDVTFTVVKDAKGRWAGHGWQMFLSVCNDHFNSERERCALHLDDMAARAESPAIKAAYKLAAQQIRAMQ